MLLYNQYLIKIICKLLEFICKFLPLKHWNFDDSNSPEYQKFKVDILPKIIKFQKSDYKLLIAYYKHKYGYVLRPINRRNGETLSKDIRCPNVVLLTIISTIIMVAKVRCNAKYAKQISLAMNQNL